MPKPAYVSCGPDAHPTPHATASCRILATPIALSGWLFVGCENAQTVDPPTSGTGDGDPMFGTQTTGLTTMSGVGTGGESSPATSGESGASTGEDDTRPLAGPCPPHSRLGRFELLRLAAETNFSGEVRSHVYVQVSDTDLDQEGDCQLVHREYPTCTPLCQGQQVCDALHSCIDYPYAQSVGVVEVEGLNTELRLSPPPDNYYFDTELPHPAYADGASLHLRAAGDQMPGFTLRGIGVAQHEVVGGTTPRPFVPGKPFALEWASGPLDPRIRVELRLLINQHGTSPAYIVCNSADVGRLEIPARLVDGLLALGVTGFPSVTVTRQSADSVLLDNHPERCVEFTVRAATREIPLAVDGHTPCATDADCPEGQFCDLAIQTCI